MKWYPKTELGFALLYSVGVVAWLVVVGVAALIFRTILLSPHLEPAPNYDPATLYYTLVTIHGQPAPILIVEEIALALLAYSMHKAGMAILHKKLVAISFWLQNLGMVVFYAGGPLMGWYMYPPLALQEGSWIHYKGAMIGFAYFMMALSILGTIIAAFTMFVDAYKTRPKDKKIPIFAAYTMAFGGMFMPLTQLALLASVLWYVLYFWAGVPVNPLTWVVLFWFFGHPVVYYAPFTIFGGLYEIIPRYAGRALYSEKWARWTLLFLFTIGMIAWVHHLQTWPVPTDIRVLHMLLTLVLASGSGLTVLNLGLTILTGKGYNWKDPVGLAAVIALMGFILSGLQALINPINPLDVIVHNTYYIVGHFHLMIWTLITAGFIAILLDMLRSLMGNMDFSSLARGLFNVGLIMWSVFGLLLGYTMSIAGYDGLLRRVMAYPVEFLPFMSSMTYLAIGMAVSFIILALPIIGTILPIKTSAFWVPTRGGEVPGGLSSPSSTPGTGGGTVKTYTTNENKEMKG